MEMDIVIVIERSSQRKHSVMEMDIVIVTECSSKEPQRYGNGHRSSSLSVCQRNHSAMEMDIVIVIECSTEQERYGNGHSHRH